MDALVVYCHPDSKSYCRQLKDCVVSGLTSAGHRVDVIDLYADGFDPVMSADEHRAYMDDAPIFDDITADYARRIESADALVFVYPTWWGTLPAMLKGWLDRVLVPGVAFTLDKRRKVQPNLTRVKRIVGVSTYGSPRWYFWLIHDGGRRILHRSLRATTKFRAHTDWFGLYGIEGISNAARKKFLVDIERKMAEL